MVFRISKRYFISKIFLCVVLISLPFEGFVIFSNSIFSISIPLFFSILLLFTAILEIICKGRIVIDQLYSIVFLILIAGTLTGFNVINKDMSLLEYIKSFIYIFFLSMFFIFVSQIQLSEREIKYFLLIQLILGSIIAIIGIYQAIANNSNLLPDLYFKLNSPVTGTQRASLFGTYERPSSVFAEPSWFGHYLIYYLFIGMGLLKEKHNRQYIRSLLFIIFIGIILSVSIGTYLLMVFVLLVFYITYYYKIQKKLIFRNINKLFIATFALILIFSNTFGLKIWSSLLYRLYTINRSFSLYIKNPVLFTNLDSITMRLSLSFSGLVLWLQSPLSFLFGWGLGNYLLAFKRYAGFTFGYSGIGWVNILVEQGIVGFIFYFLFFIIFIKDIFYILPRVKNNFHLHYINISLYLTILCFFFSSFTGGFGFDRSLGIWVSLTYIRIVYRYLMLNIYKYSL